MSAEDILLDNGYEDVIVFKNPSYDTALIGVSYDDRAIYSYGKMVEWLMDNEGMTMEDARDFIDYNTLSTYISPKQPIVLFPVHREFGEY